jgi:hypothetical protein
MVKRRKVLLGMGSLAAGSAAAMGTGAFDAMSADREADINVTVDSEGLVSLVDTTDSDVIRESDNPGELLIDFTADGKAGGVNTDSQYQVGYIRGANKNFIPKGLNDQIDDTDASAFQIVNKDTVAHTLNASYECDANDIGNASVFWQFSPVTRQHNMEVSGSNTYASIQEIPQINQDDSRFLPGVAVDVSLLIDTTGVTQDSSNLDLSGTLTIEAGPAKY